LVLFFHHAGEEDVNIERGGEAWLTTTVLHGRRALRVNINSFLTEQRHVDDLLELLQRCGREAIRES